MESTSKDACHAFRCEISLPVHLSPLQCHQIVKFWQENFFWWAVKFENAPDPETGVMGKLHAHCIGVKSDWDSTRGDDPKFGAKRPVHLKKKFMKDAPSVGSVLDANPNARKYGVFLYKLNNDNYNSYFQKEGEMMYQNLPDDPATLYRYFATKRPKVYNQAIKAHCDKLDELGYPRTKQAVAEYLNYRMCVINDMAIPARLDTTKNLCTNIWAVWSGMGFDLGVNYDHPLSRRPTSGTLDSNKRPRPYSFDEEKKEDDK